MVFPLKKVLVSSLAAATVIATPSFLIFSQALTASAAIASSDYALHLLFDNGFTDSSTSSLTATPVGNPTFVTGRIGSALSINSTGSAKQYVNMGKPDNLQFGTSTNFTLSLWVKSTGVTSDPAILSNKNWSSGGNVGYALALHSDKGLIWNYNTAGGSRVDAKIPNVADGAWHHIVVTHDRSTGRVDFYKDGIPAAVTNSKGSHYNNIASTMSIVGQTGTIDSGLPTIIGNDGTGNYSAALQVQLDDLQILNRAVTAQEVLDSYNTAPPLAVERFNGSVNLIGAQHTVQGSQFRYNLDLRTPTMSTVINKAEVELAYDSNLFEFVSASRATSVDTSVPGIVKLSLPGGSVYNNTNPLEYATSRISELIFNAKSSSGQGSIQVKSADFYNGSTKMDIESLNKQTATIQIHPKASEDLNKDGHVTIGDVVLALGDANDILQGIAKQVKFTPYKRVVVIGIDGGGVSVSPNAPYWETASSVKETVGSRLVIPAIRNIIEHGAITYTAKTTLPSSSSPNWGAMITGVDYSKHLLDNPDSAAYTYSETSPYPSFFKKLRAAMPATKLAAFATWKNILGGHIEPSLGVEGYSLGDESNAAAFAQYAASGKAYDASVIFFQLDDMDHAGHNYGFYTKKYYQQLNKTDKNVETIYNALKDNQLLDDTLIVMLPDHGGGTENANHTLGSSTLHGQDSPLAITTFIAAKGRTVATDVGKEKVLQGGTTKDLAATVLSALGVNPTIGDSKVIDGMFIPQKDQHNAEASNLKLTKVISSTTEQLKSYELSIDQLKSDAKAMDIEIETTNLTVKSVNPAQAGVKVLREETANGVTRLILSSDTGIVPAEPIVKISVESQGSDPSAALKSAMVADSSAKETMPNFTSVAKEESDIIPVSGVEVTSANPTILEGQTAELRAKVLPATASNTNVTWTTSDSSVASIEQVSDKVVIRGIKTGTATITATTAEGNFTSQSLVTVQTTPLVTTLSSIQLKGTTYLYSGQQNQTVVKATYSDHSVTQIVYGVVYNSTAPSIAKIDAKGLVSALQVGTTVIKATYGGLTDQYTLTVRYESGESSSTDAPINNAGKTITKEETKPIETPKEVEPAKPVLPHIFNGEFIKTDLLIKNMASKIEEAKKQINQDQFTDLPATHWAAGHIHKFAAIGVVQGYKDGKFEPNGKVTRAEFATLISRVFAVDGQPVRTLTLNDLSGHWAKTAIEKLANLGIVNGYEDSSFRPDETISRAEMVTLISRIVNMRTLHKESTSSFADIGSSFAKEQINEAVKAGIINGSGDGNFHPDMPSTRAEALTVIMNVLNLNPDMKRLLDSLK
ncbi:S-layer homology domain-containing protein [Paenibacillus planticolens]|uniref:Sulfatase-like hydrolase/transferase n=1 Tax=Paenibacillus planticolens TaxID=2654976 RepID=A0ABX1ZQB7_9BACL|nr:S-layer homology domain-containing protein [Paenibacillus planticolens]NOV01053.1 sulfatase-like hydrolase/transferase [Paenibacillus planticolens]